MISITSVEAQNRFGQLLDTVQREPVSITRHGRPAAFIVSPRDMDELLGARQKRARAVAELSAWSRTSKRRATKAASALTDREVNRLVHEAR
jgi:prevent-host-death family protein